MEVKMEEMLQVKIIFKVEQQECKKKVIFV